MDSLDILSNNNKQRIVQELVPGKQITIAHVIANPDEILYEKLGLDPASDKSKGSIGIICMSPAETAIIAGDIAIKSSNANIGFIDRFSGTVIITGTISQVQESITEVLNYTRDVLKFTTCNLTKT